MTEKVDDDELITALLSSSTRKQAAEKVGLTTRTIYNRLQKDDFLEKLERAKEERKERLNNLLDTATVCALEKAIEILETDTDSFEAVSNSITTETQLAAARIILQGYSR